MGKGVWERVKEGGKERGERLWEKGGGEKYRERGERVERERDRKEKRGKRAKE